MWKISAKIKLWPTSAAPWHYIDVPGDIVAEAAQFNQARGLLKVQATVKNFSWQTSLMPAGKGKKIIPIKAEVRKKFNLSVGGTIELEARPIET